MSDQIQICPKCSVTIYRDNVFYSHCKKSGVGEVTPENIYDSYKQAYTLGNLNDKVCSYARDSTCINPLNGQSRLNDSFKMNVK